MERDLTCNIFKKFLKVIYIKGQTIAHSNSEESLHFTFRKLLVMEQKVAERFCIKMSQRMLTDELNCLISPLEQQTQILELLYTRIVVAEKTLKEMKNAVPTPEENSTIGKINKILEAIKLFWKESENLKEYQYVQRRIFNCKIMQKIVDLLCIWSKTFGFDTRAHIDRPINYSNYIDSIEKLYCRPLIINILDILIAFYAGHDSCEEISIDEKDAHIVASFLTAGFKDPNGALFHQDIKDEDQTFRINLLSRAAKLLLVIVENDNGAQMAGWIFHTIERKTIIKALQNASVAASKTEGTVINFSKSVNVYYDVLFLLICRLSKLDTGMEKELKGVQSNLTHTRKSEIPIKMEDGTHKKFVFILPMENSSHLPKKRKSAVIKTYFYSAEKEDSSAEKEEKLLNFLGCARKFQDEERAQQKFKKWSKYSQKVTPFFTYCILALSLLINGIIFFGSPSTYTFVSGTDAPSSSGPASSPGFSFGTVTNTPQSGFSTNESCMSEPYANDSPVPMNTIMIAVYSFNVLNVILRGLEFFTLIGSLLCQLSLFREELAKITVSLVGLILCLLATTINISWNGFLIHLGIFEILIIKGCSIGAGILSLVFFWSGLVEFFRCGRILLF
jgi:hypothetical protein